MRISNVLYYFYLQFDELQCPLAVIKLFSPPDASHLSQLNQTVYLCDALEGHNAIRVVSIASIKSLISIFPDLMVTSDGELVNTKKFALLRHPFNELARYNTEGLFDDDEEEKIEPMY
jgi:hypothetical protein